MTDSFSDIDRGFLARAIRLAMDGRGTAEPNPMVGCVIVRDGTVIGEGYHERFGGPHAESNALASCGESARGATAYVTLAPCCHTNKKTPPCVPALIAAGISRVVVGCDDPNPQVSGKGIAQLRSAGVHVDQVDDPACRQLIAPYVAGLTHHRPYITLKWAQSADGKVAGPGGQRVQISNRRSQRMIHELRGRSDAILIGIGTAVADDPLLTARHAECVRPMIRIVLDSDLRLSTHSQLVRTVDQGKVILFCSKEAAEYSGTRVALAACGVEIHPISAESPGRLDLRQVVREIGKMSVTHLLVEPGPTLAQSFFRQELWDRAWVIRSEKMIGDATAPSAPPAVGVAVGTFELEGDVLTECLNPAGVFSAPVASADLALGQFAEISGAGGSPVFPK